MTASSAGRIATATVVTVPSCGRLKARVLRQQEGTWKSRKHDAVALVAAVEIRAQTGSAGSASYGNVAGNGPGLEPVVIDRQIDHESGAAARAVRD